MSPRTRIAAAVAYRLTSAFAAGAFGAGYAATEAQRKYVPAGDLPSMATLQATVFLAAEIRTAATREATQKDVDVFVGLQKRLTTACDPTTGADAELDALAELAEGVAQHFEPTETFDGTLLDAMDAPVGTWIETRCDPIADVADLLQRRVFTTVITLTFRHFA